MGRPMSIDAVAVLHISSLPQPPTILGIKYPLEHREDATLINLMYRFDSVDADEHALNLRRLLGAALNAHRDPRGILFFPDVRYPTAATYRAIVEEMSAAGVWGPNVPADYVPKIYRAAPDNTHEALVAQMMDIMGRDAAEELDRMAWVGRMGVVQSPERADFAESYATRLDAVSKAMGAEFAARYRASLDARVAAFLREAADRRTYLQNLLGQG